MTTPSAAQPDVPYAPFPEAELTQFVKWGQDETGSVSKPSASLTLTLKNALLCFAALRERCLIAETENAQLQRREREALDAHAASFGALQAVSVLTDLNGEVDDYQDVARAVQRLADSRETKP